MHQRSEPAATPEDPVQEAVNQIKQYQERWLEDRQWRLAERARWESDRERWEQREEEDRQRLKEDRQWWKAEKLQRD